MKRLPTFKYVEDKYGTDSTLKGEWNERLGGKEWEKNTGQLGKTFESLAKRTDMTGLGKQCDEGGGTGNQMCKVGYNYQKVKISEYKNRVNDRARLPVYQVRSMDNPEVTFNAVKYVPSMIYVMDPLANYQGGKLTEKLEGGADADGDKSMYPFTMHNALPKDPTAYRGDLYGDSAVEGSPFNTQGVEKKLGAKDKYSQFIIEHRPVQSERTDLLWIVVPMKIFVDASGGRYGGEPTSPFESALKWMLQRWVDKVSDERTAQGYLQGDTYDGQVELKDAIPNLPTMSPYLYIRHYGNGKLHHVLHFKERHIRTVGVEYYVGGLNGLKERYPVDNGTKRDGSRRRYRGDVYFEGDDLDDDTDVDVYNSQGDNLVKNKQGVTRSRKGLNMTCKPVKVGGNKYNDDYKYELVSGEIKKQSDDWKDRYKNKYFSGQGRNFGIALVILMLMILLVVVGSFFMTRRNMSAS